MGDIEAERQKVFSNDAESAKMLADFKRENPKRLH